MTEVPGCQRARSSSALSCFSDYGSKTAGSVLLQEGRRGAELSLPRVLAVCGAERLYGGSWLEHAAAGAVPRLPGGSVVVIQRWFRLCDDGGLRRLGRDTPVHEDGVYERFTLLGYLLPSYELKFRQARQKAEARVATTLDVLEPAM